MMPAYLEKRSRLLDWRCIQRNFYWVCAVLFAFAAGGWAVSVRVEEQRLPYLERSTLRFESVQRLAGANPETAIKCERRRGDKAEDVASQAVESAVTDNDRIIPDLNSIPECPAPKK